MQKLSDMYNIRIIRLYGAAGHGKGLIDAMSSFCVKSILRRDVIPFEKWFENSEDICFYLTQRYDDRMLYSLVDVESVDSSRQCKDAIAINTINGCMVGHLFVFEPNSKNILIREYLRECKNCLLLEVQNCLSISESESNDNVECQEKSWLADDESNKDPSQVFEFVDVPSFVALISCSSSEPVYFVKIEKRGISKRNA